MNFVYKDMTHLERNSELPLFLKRELYECIEEMEQTKLIYSNEEVIGFVELDVLDIVRIKYIYITPKERHKHNGYKIIDDIKNSYESKRIVVNLRFHSYSVVSFFEANGFIKLNSQSDHEQITMVEYSDLHYNNLMQIHIKQEHLQYVSKPIDILYKHLKNKDTTKLMILYINEQVIGCLLVRMNPEINNLFIWQYVIDEYQSNKGYGYIILNYFINHYKILNQTTSITTTVINGNYNSHNLFLKLGFTILEQLEAETNYIK